MKVLKTEIPGPLIIEPQVFGDDRGFFLESWNAERFRAAGLDFAFVQDNHSRSARGVLRGPHFQNPNPQGKLVRVTAGRVWDVAVDLRKASAHFGKWIGVELSAANKRMCRPGSHTGSSLSKTERTFYINAPRPTTRPRSTHFNGTTQRRHRLANRGSSALGKGPSRQVPLRNYAVRLSLRL